MGIGSTEVTAILEAQGFNTRTSIYHGFIDFWASSGRSPTGSYVRAGRGTGMLTVFFEGASAYEQFLVTDDLDLEDIVNFNKEDFVSW